MSKSVVVSRIRRVIVSLWITVLGLAGTFVPGWCQAQKSSALAQGLTASVLRKVEVDSSGSSARIVMDLSREARYEAHQLKEDPAKGLPLRTYVDLFGARLHPEAGRLLVVEDGLVSRVRTGQFSGEVVRVVVDMKTPGQPKAYSIKEPFRVILELEPEAGEKNRAALQRRMERALPNGAGKPAGPQLRKIVLDPGHGGKDPGAIGVGGVKEKDLVLSIAKKLAHKLRKEMGVAVTLTREGDTFIPLEDRTAIANAENADLFISLHVNASPNPQARGLETYYLDNTDDEAAIRLAERENATSRRNVSDLQFILSDLIQSSKMEDSIRLAHHIQGSMVSQVSQRYRGTVDLGVKRALFYVLVGARMPSVLVEISFITNRIEGRNLTTAAYQNTVVNALYEGIQRYRDSAFAARNL